MEGFCTVCEHEEDHDGGGIGVCRRKGCGCDGSPPEADAYDGPAMRLMADMMQANSDSLARTTDHLRRQVEAERDQYADWFLQFYNEVIGATSTATTRKLEGVLAAWEHRIERVERAFDAREERS